MVYPLDHLLASCLPGLDLKGFGYFQTEPPVVVTCFSMDRVFSRPVLIYAC